jgi:hypothetical protein
MKAAISVTGLLTITPETPSEAYALRCWDKEGEQRYKLWCNYDAPLDPGPVPPRLPGDLTDLPVMPAEILDGDAAAPAEMPSDELMEQWVEEACRVHTASGYHINASTTMARLAIAWARQQQAQSPQLPPPGADPVATDGDLLKVLDSILWADDARRALYARGRADERTAILRALGVEP